MAHQIPSGPVVFSGGVQLDPTGGSFGSAAGRATSRDRGEPVPYQYNYTGLGTVRDTARVISHGQSNGHEQVHVMPPPPSNGSGKTLMCVSILALLFINAAVGFLVWRKTHLTNPLSGISTPNQVVAPYTTATAAPFNPALAPVIAPPVAAAAVTAPSAAVGATRPSGKFSWPTSLPSTARPSAAGGAIGGSNSMALGSTVGQQDATSIASNGYHQQAQLQQQQQVASNAGFRQNAGSMTLTDGGAAPAANVFAPSSTVAPTAMPATAVATGTTASAAAVSLFCIALVQSVAKGGDPNLVRTAAAYSDEPTLLKSQLEQRRGIFACDGWEVYSNVSIPLSSTYSTQLVPGDLTCPFSTGKFGGNALNTEIFIRLWKALAADGKFATHDWVIKADADTVFFPSRLRDIVQKDGDKFKGKVYLNNCHWGLHGPIEVVSREAMQVFLSSMPQCDIIREHAMGPRRFCADTFPPGCDHNRSFGEDQYLRFCLESLGTRKVDEYDVLSEVACPPRFVPMRKTPPPCDTANIAFHPFKTVAAWSTCWSAAKDSPLWGQKVHTNVAPTSAVTNQQVAQASSAVPSGQRPGLYCFSLIMPAGYEHGLLRWQYAARKSIFACDAFAVFSNRSIDLGGIHTEVINVNLQATIGGKFHTWVNAPIFQKIWRRVISDGQYRTQEWTVKADPDAVFLPARLQDLVHKRSCASAQQGNGMFLNNCWNSADVHTMHGALEVMSRRALDVYAERGSSCPQAAAEDNFMRLCLQTLGVTQMNDDLDKLLADAAGECGSGKPGGCLNGHVSFHPFKQLPDYQQCLSAAENSGQWP